MKVIDITDFSHVIERALQRKLFEDALEKSLSFSELWRVAEAAAPLQPGAGSVSLSKTALARAILWNTEMLEEGMIITREVHSGKLFSITLTEFGERHLRSTIFSHQERAPG